MNLPVTVRAGGKVNLFLRVLSRRADGYHEIETVLHGVSLHDEITISDSRPRLTVEVELDGVSGGLPLPEENLAFKAAALMLDAGLTPRGSVKGGLAVHITKRIPIAAGMGGGSADAAGVVVALNEVAGRPLGWEALIRLAAKLGSDVPYSIGGGTQLATGRGELLTPLPAPEPMWFVLGISHEPLSTRTVYEAWPGNGGNNASAPLALALGAGEIEEVAALLYNDLEPATFSLRPELEGKKEEMVAAGALGALVSGSGPTIFGVCRSPEQAQQVAVEVEGTFDAVTIVTSRTRSIEVAGVPEPDSFPSSVPPADA